MGDSQLHAEVSYGLTIEDRLDIENCVTSLPGDWEMRVEQTEDGGYYACVLAPWHDETMSAFLIDRCGEAVVLTDRLSSILYDNVSEHSSVQDAIRTAQGVIRGSKERFVPVDRLDTLIKMQDA